MARFDKIEQLYGETLRKLQREFKKQGYPNENWDTLHKYIFLILIRDCLQDSLYCENVDLICDYWLDQYERGGFIALWEISNKLIGQGDMERLVKLWRAALRQRREYKVEFREFFQCYESILVKAGLIEEIFSARKDFELNLAVKTSQSSDWRIMSSSLFWDFIQKAKQSSERSDERAYELSCMLMNLEPSEIVRFERIFYEKMSASYTWDLWAAAYLAFGGCSDDGFEYFRAWLISEGRENFEAVLGDVNQIAELNLVPQQFEDLLGLASKCYKTKTGVQSKCVYTLAEKLAGEEWEENDGELKKRYPSLWKYFNNQHS